MSIRTIKVTTNGQGLHDITLELKQTLKQMLSEQQIDEGLCTAFIQHTSASLLIQENYDSSARVDLENWLTRLVPEQDTIYTHTLEGADDMPAHIKAALTPCSLSIPVVAGKLALGTWQGVFVWEHRHGRQSRTVIVHVAE